MNERIKEIKEILDRECRLQCLCGAPNLCSTCQRNDALAQEIAEIANEKEADV